MRFSYATPGEHILYLYTASQTASLPENVELEKKSLLILYSVHNKTEYKVD